MACSVLASRFVDLHVHSSLIILLVGATAQVEETIKAIRKFPNQFKCEFSSFLSCVYSTLTTWSLGLTVFQLECLHTKAIHRPDAPVSPILSPSRDAPILSNVPRADNTAVETELISAFEKAYFYHGLSLNPPKLFHRSDLLTRPFAMQTKGKFSKIPQKTAHGVYDQVLNPIWRSMVCPEIVALLKDKNRGVRVSSILPVRFSTPDDNDNPVFGPIVIWISVHPRTTAVTACRDANPDILAILESHGVMGAAVHWIEGAVEPLVSPAMMHVVDDTNPTAYIRRALTASLGIPLVTADNNSQGSLGIYFHEGKDEQGNESDRVFAITNKHVVSRVTNTDYDILRAGSSKQYVRVCDYHRLQGVVNETRASIATKIRDAVRLIEVLADLPARPPPRDQNKAAMYAKRMEIELEYLREDAATLQKFLHNLNLSWSDPYRRFIGWVDWAPSIRNDIDDRRYTRDIGVIELEKSKWEKAFNGNQVYLGTSHLLSLFLSHLKPLYQAANILLTKLKLCSVPIMTTRPPSNTPSFIYLRFKILWRPQT